MSEIPSKELADHKLALPEASQWKVGRIDLRSPVGKASWPVARVELEHASRGRVTDIASAPGAFDAVFLAAGHIVGVRPPLLRFDVHSASPAADHALAITVAIAIELDGEVYEGASFGVDLVECALSAWLKAISKVHRRSGGLPFGKPRAYQLSGIDPNNDLWIFASEDEGAVLSIQSEFLNDGYTSVELLRGISGAVPG